MKITCTLLLFLLVGLNSLAKDTVKKPAKHSYTITYDQHLGVAINERTLDSLKISLNGFYKNIMDSATRRKYWIASDFTAPYSEPYAYLKSEMQILGPGKLQPNVISITPDSISSDYVAHIAYIKLGALPSVEQMNYVLLSKDASGNYKLKKPTDYLTRNWKHYTVGSIEYIVTPNKQFNRQEAVRMDSFSRAIATYFHTDVIPVKFYSCGYYPYIWYPWGQDNFFMTGNYNRLTGGQAVPLDKSIYCGNNSEYYPHELVHVYTTFIAMKLTGLTYISPEGVSTFLGGSQGYDLEYHLKSVAKYSREHKLTKLEEVFNIPDGVIGDYNETEVRYAINGLVIKLVDDKQGYQGILKILTSGDESQAVIMICDMYKIKPETIYDFLMKELMKY